MHKFISEIVFFSKNGKKKILTKITYTQFDYALI
jgi:hypothetical protein